MNKISLQPIGRALLHEYYSGFVMDADIFMDINKFQAYTCSPGKVDAYYDRLQSQEDRMAFLMMGNGKPIGEIALKHMDVKAKQCELPDIRKAGQFAIKQSI
ncbi:MAG: hypothetical protein IJ214_08915 [Clostridia bacterium]|nr:hypothetical protein [Clostridia bacterium]